MSAVTEIAADLLCPRKSAALGQNRTLAVHSIFVVDELLASVRTEIAPQVLPRTRSYVTQYNATMCNEGKRPCEDSLQKLRLHTDSLIPGQLASGPPGGGTAKMIEN
jgi:hypothetical protein